MSIHLRIAFILSLVGLSACGTNRAQDASQENAATASQTDITRPPVFVKSTSDEAEGDPEETISLEEWQKEQQEDE